MSVFNKRHTSSPYIVAEINTSHFGNMDTAKEMINRCKDMDVDCVKFQSWTEDTLYPSSFYEQNPITKRFFKKYSLDESKLLEIANYCNAIEIDFASTPYSTGEVEFLIEECKAKFVKIASMDINNIQYLEFIAKKQYPTVLSTGMAKIDEIKRAVEIFDLNNSKDLCLLHCVSVYPCPIEICNLKNIVLLSEAFPDVPIGYSDHTKGTEAAITSVALGARLIEKHFTLDNKKIGLDNQMATEPKEFSFMVAACKNAYLSLGSKERILSKEEEAQALEMRRSAVALHDLNQGKIIRSSDIEFKRPGTGIAPDKFQNFLGKKLNTSVKKGELIHEINFQQN